MIILQYHEIFFRLTAPRCPGMAPGAISLRKSHDIVILSFCIIVKCQANSFLETFAQANSFFYYHTVVFYFNSFFYFFVRSFRSIGKLPDCM